VRANRLIRVRVIAIAIFALLFAQLSLAAYVCPMAATGGAGTMAPSGCASMSRQDQTSPNLCAGHCQYGEQGDQPRTPTAPAVSLISLYVLPLTLALTVPIRHQLEASGLLAAPPPPHTILHCCFRI
jgi:hypothetical protein